MIPRYANDTITKATCNAAKYQTWQEIELAALEARAEAGAIQMIDFAIIRDILTREPINEEWLEKEERSSHHDYNAFLAERRRHLPPVLRRLFHGEMTSFDGEEPAASLIMLKLLWLIVEETEALEAAIICQIEKHRFTPRLERTHGRCAEIQSVGRFFITHLATLKRAKENVCAARNGFELSKLSGAIGSDSGLSPKIQQSALAKLGLVPFDGATQIMPRIFHSQAASALADLASWLEKMAFDLWLGSRDPFPTFEEPFRPKQKGSSAMPWKKNPITLEKVMGMARYPRALAIAIRENIVTPEGRDISQSSVERLVWPDLFHTVAHMLACMTKVMDGLNIYVDNLAREIALMRGTYAGSKAKELLAEWFEGELDADEVYRIVQLAGFNVTEPRRVAAEYRKRGAPQSLEDADYWTECVEERVMDCQPQDHFRDIIRTGTLRVSLALDISEETVTAWNQILRKLFSDEQKVAQWEEIFKPSYWLRFEQEQVKRVLGG